MKAIHALIFLLIAWLLLTSRRSSYQDVQRHSFELAGFKEDRHKLLHGNFYFYIKNPENKNFFTS